MGVSSPHPSKPSHRHRPSAHRPVRSAEGPAAAPAKPAVRSHLAVPSAARVPPARAGGRKEEAMWPVAARDPGPAGAGGQWPGRMVGPARGATSAKRIGTAGF